jgi:hypothetical protein
MDTETDEVFTLTKRRTWKISILQNGVPSQLFLLH